jgi:hypothetical protein
MEELTPFKNENIWWKSRYYLAFIKNVKTIRRQKLQNQTDKSIRLSVRLVVLNSFYAVLKYPKYLAKQECRLLLVLQDIYTLMEQSKKDKSTKSILR